MVECISLLSVQGRESGVYIYIRVVALVGGKKKGGAVMDEEEV